MADIINLDNERNKKYDELLRKNMGVSKEKFEELKEAFIKRLEAQRRLQCGKD